MSKSFETKQHIKAMRWSLGIGLFMFGIKWIAYILSNSSAIFSEAMESIVHVIAICFAFYSLKLSLKPGDEDHPYGHDRVVFFSAGFEGLMICLAAGIIIYESINKLLLGVELERIDIGLWLIAFAALGQLVLGRYLVNLGEKTQALLIKANGKHLLTDFWTSFGVLFGLILVLLTGTFWLDSLVAIAVSLNILREGIKLIKESVDGLMDRTNPQNIEKINALCHEAKSQYLIAVHNIRSRSMGHATWVDLHLIFADELSLKVAHKEATIIENHISTHLAGRVYVNSHIEPANAHDDHHQTFRQKII